MRRFRKLHKTTRSLISITRQTICFFWWDFENRLKNKAFSIRVLFANANWNCFQIKSNIFDSSVASLSCRSMFSIKINLSYFFCVCLKIARFSSRIVLFNSRWTRIYVACNEKLFVFVFSIKSNSSRIILNKRRYFASKIWIISFCRIFSRCWSLSFLKRSKFCKRLIWFVVWMSKFLKSRSK